VGRWNFGFQVMPVVDLHNQVLLSNFCYYAVYCQSRFYISSHQNFVVDLFPAKVGTKKSLTLKLTKKKNGKLMSLGFPLN
jgi:hypothetical protein